MVLNVLILERKENQSTRRKTFEAQERSTMRNSTQIFSCLNGKNNQSLKK